MGCQCCKSYRIFVVNPNIKGQEAHALADFHKIGLTAREINAFWTVFYDIDEDQSGHISIREFYRFFSLQQSEFIDAVFTLLDDDNSGEIDFREFVIALWNFCSYSLQNLAVFAFSLFDVDGSNRLDLAEVRDLVNAVYGDRLEENKRVERILDSLDQDGSGEVTIQEFLLYNKQYPLLLYPAYSIQNHLRIKVLGERFWKRIENKRETEFRRQNVFEILDCLDKEAKAQIMGVESYETILNRVDESNEPAKKEKQRHIRIDPALSEASSQVLGGIKDAIRAKTPASPFSKRRSEVHPVEDSGPVSATASNAKGRNNSLANSQRNNSSLASSPEAGGIVGTHLLNYSSNEDV